MECFVRFEGFRHLRIYKGVKAISSRLMLGLCFGTLLIYKGVKDMT